MYWDSSLSAVDIIDTENPMLIHEPYKDHIARASYLYNRYTYIGYT